MMKARITPDYRPLSLDGSYLCPICRHGDIASLVLMDAFACNFCRHMFSTNLESQTVEVVDSSQPISWWWNGRTWQSTRWEDQRIQSVLWLMGGAIVLLPPLIVGLSVYAFPPLPNSPLSWFPVVWVLGTFVIHLLMMGWLMAEHYQFPWYVSMKIRLRSLMERVNPG